MVPVLAFKRQRHPTVSAAVLFTPEYDAVIVTLRFFLVVFVAIVNVFVVVPCATTTLPGTVASEVFELDSVTVVPPAGAAADSVTAPVAEDPPEMLVGLIESDASATGGGGGGGAALTVNVVALLTPLYVAVSVPTVFDETLVVPIAKLALLAPCATGTDGGTLAAPMFDDSATLAPPAGAPAVSVTVPVDDAPPVTADGFAAIPLNAIA